MHVRGLVCEWFIFIIIIIIYYLRVRVGVNHASMIHNFAYAEHDKQDYDRGKIELERWYNYDNYIIIL